MSFVIMLLVLSLSLLILFLFFFTSKSQKWERLMGAGFECGFSSYFFSRFSFSIHYFLIALIFLFLDLELCLLMPLFMEFFSPIALQYLVVAFVIFLLICLMAEWFDSKLNWLS